MTNLMENHCHGLQNILKIQPITGCGINCNDRRELEYEELGGVCCLRTECDEGTSGGSVLCSGCDEVMGVSVVWGRDTETWKKMNLSA